MTFQRQKKETLSLPNLPSYLKPKSMFRKTSLKKKKSKGTLIMFQRQKKTKEPSSPLTFHSPSRNPGPERYSLKKKSKGMLSPK
jgi:hypothetical protein